MKTGFQNNTIVLGGFFLVVILQQILWKLLGVDFPLVGYIDDVVYLLFIFIVIANIGAIIKEKFIIYCLVSYALFLAFGIVSSFFVSYTKSIAQILLQILVDFKLIIFMLLFYIYRPSWKAIFIFEKIIKITLLISLPLCLFQLIAPGAYNGIFNKAPDRDMFDIGNYSFARVEGLFVIPGVLAVFTVMTGFYFIFINKNKIYASIALFELIFSFERQETATFFLLLVWLLVIRKPKFKYKFYFLTGLVALFVLVNWYTEIQQNVQLIANNFSFQQIQMQEQPRLIVYLDGYLLALLHFPFGVGFGNFGGFSAEKYDSVLYYKYHFDQFGWFKVEDFLTDTYYPHLFAEAGFLGFFFYLLSFYYIIRLFLVSIKFTYIKDGILLLFLFIFLDGLTAPVLNDPSTLLLVGFIYVIARKLNEEKIIFENLKLINN